MIKRNAKKQVWSTHRKSATIEIVPKEAQTVDL